MSVVNFVDWLQNELNKRNWSQADLARRSGVAPGTISRIMNNSRGVGPELLNLIAIGLRLPPEQVFRAAGLLPEQENDSPRAEEAKFLFQQIPEEDQEIIIQLMRVICEKKGAYRIQEENE